MYLWSEYRPFWYGKLYQADYEYLEKIYKMKKNIEYLKNKINKLAKIKINPKIRPSSIFKLLIEHYLH